MRILDNDSDKAMSNILILLTQKEAKIVVGYLEQMLENKERDGDHSHINDDSYQHEITVAIYDEKNYDNNDFHPRVIKLIQDDE